MNIAIDVSPLQSGHKIRGVGFYLEYLKRSLVEYFPENDYLFFTKLSEIPHDIDLIHYPYFDPFFLTLPLSQKHKTVVTVHDLTPLVFPSHFPAGIKGSIRWRIQKFNLKGVDAIIADSYSSKGDITKIVGVPEEKVFVAHLAAAKEFRKFEQHDTKIDILRKKYSLPKKFALYVGDVTWNKNVPRILQAAVKADVPLVMVGKSLLVTDLDTTNPWNADLLQVQKLAEKHANIIRLGFVPTEDLVALYNAATVFVFPSIYEGFGLPVIEAMQSGCPVITTTGGSLKEVAGTAALYVDAYAIDHIASEMKHVMNARVLQKELSLKGLAQAKRFSWKQTAQDTIDVYKKVLFK